MVYEANVEFRYTVGGKSYTAQAGSDYSTSDYAEMKQKVKTYAPGTHHPIRYNPGNPSDISYDAGFTIGFFLVPLIVSGAGLIAVSTGVVLFLIGWGMGEATVRCTSCGQVVMRSEKVCPKCGAAFSSSGAGR